MKSKILYSVLFMVFFLAGPAFARAEYELLSTGDVVAQERYSKTVTSNSYQRNTTSDRQLTRASDGSSDSYRTPASQGQYASDPRDPNKIRRSYIAAQNEYYVEPSARSPRSFSFDAGYEGYHYNLLSHYSSSRTNVTNKGYQSGIFAAALWAPKGMAYLPDMYRLEARWASGDVKNEDSGFTNSGISNYAYELRGLVGKRLPVGNSVVVTPYTGLGWRYLNDDQKDAVIGAGAAAVSKFEKETRYAYIPIGADVNFAFGRGWGVKLNFEGDYIFNGKHTDHFEDVNNVNTGASLGYSEHTYNLKKGYGLRTSVRLSKVVMGHSSLFVEPFYRYWSTGESDRQVSSSSAGQPSNQVFSPKTEIEEIGVKAGVMF